MRTLLTGVALSMFMIAPQAMATEASYVFLLRDYKDPYWMAVSKGISLAADAHRIGNTVYFIDSGRSEQEELTLCQTVIKEHPQFVAMAASSSSVAEECAEKAAKAGVAFANIETDVILSDEEKEDKERLPAVVGAHIVNLAFPATDKTAEN